MDIHAHHAYPARSFECGVIPALLMFFYHIFSGLSYTYFNKRMYYRCSDATPSAQLCPLKLCICVETNYVL